MGPELEHILTIGAVLACGSAIQCAAGFGFGLFTIPTLVVLGCEPYEAIVLVSVGATTQGIAGMVALRKHVRWGRILAMVGLAALAQPVGVVVLETLVEHNERLVRRMFGGLVLLALIMMITLRPRPRERLPLWTMVASMLAAGFMGGVSGMSGPPAVLWVISHRWSADESRVTLRSGATLRLEDSQDVGGNNAGLLVYGSGDGDPEYVPWDEVRKLVFKH